MQGMNETGSSAHAMNGDGKRRAGILLHITSLPGPLSQGDLGGEAYRFVDFLATSGMCVWQMLPLGPTHEDGSPYQCLSVHAGNPLLISLDILRDKGWLRGESGSTDKGRLPESIQSEFSYDPSQANLDEDEDDVDTSELRQHDPQQGREEQAGKDQPPSKDQEGSEHTRREVCLRQAFDHFQRHGCADEKNAYEAFKSFHADWLDDYALYSALRHHYQQAPWYNWPLELRDRHSDAIQRMQNQLILEIEHARFVQYLFFQQWQGLKQYAHSKGICLFGDMPIFVAHDSAEVWAHREFFAVDSSGKTTVVAGVPPDYFSASGQRWGNPHYDWQRLQADGFSWWIQRMRTQLALFDLVRVDHFRGFEAYWEVPGDAETAVQGRWVKAPGEALLHTLHDTLGQLPLVAEDLGSITPEVDALRQRFHLPGMKVLQFAFGSGPDNPYLPHHHEEHSVVYTGTHDNDTTLSWFRNLSTEERAHLESYLGYPLAASMPWPLIRCALASVAELAMIPMQDILELGEGERMNTPGTTQGNWRWRFHWDQVPANLAARLKTFLHLYNRC